MEIFNNREIAIGIWLLLFFSWALTMKGVPETIGTCVGILFSPPIFPILILTCFYIWIIVYGLYRLNFWDMSQLKNTLIWCITAGSVSFFRVTAETNKSNYFRNALKDSFKLILIFEFIIASYNIDLWIELIIIPLVTIIVVMIAIAERKEKYKKTENVLNALLAIFGITIAAFALNHFYTNFNDFTEIETLTDFVLPIVLSISFLPFLVFLSLYIRYETAFVRVNIVTDNLSLRRYAKWRAFISFRGEIQLIELWVSELYTGITNSKKNINKSIIETSELWKRHKNPKPVSKSKGWSPYTSKKYLAEIELTTGYYRQGFEDEWHATSQIKNLGDELFPNNISYSIEGDSTAATALKLRLNIYQLEQVKLAHEILLDAAELLHEKALKKTLPTTMANAILSGQTLKLNYENKCMQLEKEEWSENANRKYDLEFSIQHCL